jgi:hypothetical protein
MSDTATVTTSQQIGEIAVARTGVTVKDHFGSDADRTAGGAAVRARAVIEVTLASRSCTS